MKWLRFLLIALGAFGILDTFLISLRSNLNLGVVLPAILGLPLLLAGLFLPLLARWGQAGLGAVLKWIFLGGYALLALAFLATSAVIASAASERAPAGADALIVLGAGLHGDRPTLVLSRRLDTAYDYLLESPDTVAILSGGQGEGETTSEAHAMARYLIARGIDPARCIEEDQSRSTSENFAFSAQLIEERFGPAAALAFVTTDFHVYRAGKVAARQGVVAVGLAAPDVWYIRLNNTLRECVAIWGYALTGQI